MQRGADCVEAAGGRRVIAKANTPSKSPSGVRHGLCPWWTTLSEFIIFSIQYSVRNIAFAHSSASRCELRQYLR